MTKILHVDSSVLGAYSSSRALSAEVVARLVELHPGAEVIYRDVTVDPVLHLSPDHLAVFQGGPVVSDTLGKDLATGGAYLDELFAADVLVIGTPMYNFSIPTQLKAWIDRLLVAGKTFHYTATGPEGLLPKGKKAYVVSTRGGAYSSGPMAALDHQEKLVVAVLNFIGVSEVTVVRAEGLNLGQETKDAALAAARQQISTLAA